MNIQSAAEKACAFSDLAMGIILIPMTIFLLLYKKKSVRQFWWSLFYCFLTAASFLGYAVHYCFTSGLPNRILWGILFPLIFEVVNCFYLALYSLLCAPGHTHVIIVHAISMFGVLLSYGIPDFFPIRGIALLALFNTITALAGFVRLLRHKKAKKHKLIFIALIPLLTGALFQILPKKIYFIFFYFDNNTITHILFIIGSILLFSEIHKSLRTEFDSNNCC